MAVDVKRIGEKLKQLIERQQKAVDDNKALAGEKPQPQDFKERVGKLADEQKDTKDETKALAQEMPAAPPQQ